MTLPDFATSRLRDIVNRAIDNPASIIARDPDERYVAWAARAVAIVAVAESAMDSAMGDLENWKPTGFLNAPPDPPERQHP